MRGEESEAAVGYGNEYRREKTNEDVGENTIAEDMWAARCVRGGYGPNGGSVRTWPTPN